MWAREGAGGGERNADVRHGIGECGELFVCRGVAVAEELFDVLVELLLLLLVQG